MLLRIPKERIGVLIGPKGMVKREIERKAGVKMMKISALLI